MNKWNTVLYIGVTNSLKDRVWQHKSGRYDGFTKQYKCHKLVYFEEHGDINEAIAREKQLKNWHREWKVNLIKKMNPELRDLMGDPETSSG